MKHNPKITMILLAFFLVAQVIGLYLLNQSLEVQIDDQGNRVVEYDNTAIGERPDMEPERAFISIIVAIAIGTALALLLIKFKLNILWKVWFFVAITAAITIALGAILPTVLALLIAVILTILKILRPNIVTQNISEVLIYPGIAIIFVPLLNVFWVGALLVAISIYDMYAVWKSKHMIKLAEFQSKAKTFAGIMVPYKKKGTKKKQTVNAILGGGDIAFPMIFAGVVMTDILSGNITRIMAFVKVLPIIIFATLFLAGLFFKGKANRYYPAMPFLSAGCAVGYVVVLLLP